MNGYGTSDNRAKKMFGVILENEVELTKCKIKKEGTICAERRGVDTCSVRYYFGLNYNILIKNFVFLFHNFSN